MMRAMLFEAALALMACTCKWSWLKAWGLKIARQRGMKRAIIAVARRLAVTLHRMWVDGTDFRWTKLQAAAA
jgi:transposase